MRSRVLVLVVAAAALLVSVPSTGAEAPSDGWRRASIARVGLPVDQAHRVTDQGNRFLVLAQPVLRPGPMTFWSSDAPADKWHRMPSTGLPDDAGLGDIAASDSTVVVIAHDRTDLSVTGVWYSSRGKSWARVTGDAFERSMVNDVVEDDGSFVAVGDITLEDGRVRPMAWSSPDGVSWSRSEVPGAAVVDDPGTLVSGIGRVARSRTGWVAPGYDAGVKTIWTSPDGNTWTASASPLPDVVVDIASSPDGTVLAITEPPGVLGGSLWTSTDGVAWAPVDSFRAAFPMGSPDDLVAVGATWVVVGSTPTADGQGRTVGGWTSSDFLTWSAMPLRLSGRVTGAGLDITASDDQAVAFSSDPNESSFWMWVADR